MTPTVQETPDPSQTDGSSSDPLPRRPPLPGAMIVLVLTTIALSPFIVRTLARFGELQFPLDDPFIYLQYARNLARGYLYTWWPGDGYTAGCTSALYPWLLVPGFWLGLEDTQLVAWSWGLSVLLVLACAALAYGIGRFFAGRAGAISALVLLLATGSWLWGALSGLEIGLFSALSLLAVWLLARDSIASSPPGSSIALWLTAAGLAVARPEGFSLTVALIACVLLREGRRRHLRSWLVWPLALIPWLVVGLLNDHYAGQFVPNTAVHKSVMFFPRQSLEHVFDHARGQLLKLFLNATLTSRGRLMLPLGLPTVVLALAWLGRRTWLELKERRAFPATFLLLAILGGVASALVARGPAQFSRYYHVVFALVSVSAGLAAVSASTWARAHLQGRLRTVLPAVVVVAVLGLAVDQSNRWSAVFVRACGEIVGQQIKAARWIDKNLPKDAHILLNDVGAMTYLTHRRTFDVVGLTTNHQAQWFNEGQGAVIEKLERLEPVDRPDYFTIYPTWINLEAVTGRELFRASIDSSVVAGGRHAVVYEADWRLLGTGHDPEQPLSGRILDRLDVADLGDEAAHRYVLTVPPRERGARNNTFVGRHTGLREVIDGGRVVRESEAFDITLPAARGVTLRVRLEGDPPGVSRDRKGGRPGAGPVALEVTVDGRAAGRLEVPGEEGFHELELPLPALDGQGGRHRIEVRKVEGEAYRVFHYWIRAD